MLRFAGNNLISAICLLLSLIVYKNAQAATVTWTGASETSDYVSDAENWSGWITPQNGDDVIFDGTSTENCIWNLSVTLASLTKGSGYTGRITKVTGTSLTIAKVKRWTGGGDNELASNQNNWSNNTLPQNGDRIVFDEAASKNVTWDIDVTPDFVSLTGYTGTVSLNNDLSINGSITIASGILNLNNKNLDVDSYLLIMSDGTLNATSSIIAVKGNWANYGTFNAGTSTVILAGTNQTIYGNTTFYNLQKTVTTADTLYFEAGSTQTITNSLTLQGAADDLLSLRSTDETIGYWYLDPQGARNISYVDISYLNNRNFVSIIILPGSVDSGNNSGVSFGGSECACREDRRQSC